MDSKESSLSPDTNVTDEFEFTETGDSLVHLMYLVNEGETEGITELLESGVDVNFTDVNGRTSLHIAACQGHVDVVELLIGKGAAINPKDSWGFTPLADATYYENHDVINILEKYGAEQSNIPMHVKDESQIPKYEIDPKELDFTNSVDITKGTFRTASWRGIQVAVRVIEGVFTSDRETTLHYELALLEKIRHPNAVQFLGAVTQSSPMMIVTEYLPKGDLLAFLKRKGALKPATAVRFALDIARGMNYLHENKPEPIIHGDLEPSNVLRDDSGHLKVAVSEIGKFLVVTKTVGEDRPISCAHSCRYMAPEVCRNEEYDMKVDVFSFALILQEMIEGCPPFSTKQEDEIPKAYSEKERPPFRAAAMLYSHGIRELIEDCWCEMPANRPAFRDVIGRLERIYKHVAHKKHWKVRTVKFSHNYEAIWKKDHSNPSVDSSRPRAKDAFGSKKFGFDEKCFPYT